MSRAAFFTFATAVGAVSAVAVGCGGDDVDTQSNTEGDGSVDGFGGVDAAYGGPVFDSGKADAPFGLDSGIDANDDGSITDANDDGG